jgi:hypothetical protein
MNLNKRAQLFAMLWIIGVLLTAFVSNIGSPTGWAAAIVVAIGPSLTLLHFCKEPLQTTSQRIRAARQ